MRQSLMTMLPWGHGDKPARCRQNDRGRAHPEVVSNVVPQGKIVCLLLSLPPLVSSLWHNLVQPEDGFRIFVHNPGDTQGWSNLEQIGCQALVQAAISFSLDRLLRHIPDAGIRSLMHHGALRLQSRSHYIEWIDNCCTDSARCRTNDSRGYVPGNDVVLVTTGMSRIVALI